MIFSMRADKRIRILFFLGEKKMGGEKYLLKINIFKKINGQEK